MFQVSSFVFQALSHLKHKEKNLANLSDLSALVVSLTKPTATAD